MSALQLRKYAFRHLPGMQLKHESTAPNHRISGGELLKLPATKQRGRQKSHADYHRPPKGPTATSFFQFNQTTDVR